MLKYQQYGYNYIAVMFLYTGGRRQLAALCLRRAAVDIVFTHDTPSHLNTFTTMVDGLETELGGFARMNTLIEAQRAQNPDTLVIDGGDFSMGTLIQTVFETQAAELRMLGYRG